METCDKHSIGGRSSGVSRFAEGSIPLFVVGTSFAVWVEPWHWNVIAWKTCTGSLWFFLFFGTAYASVSGVAFCVQEGSGDVVVLTVLPGRPFLSFCRYRLSRWHCLRVCVGSPKMSLRGWFTFVSVNSSNKLANFADSLSSVVSLQAGRGLRSGVPDFKLTCSLC